MEAAERRAESRLRLAFPIRLRSGDDADAGDGRSAQRTVTHDLSARGAYFSTVGAPPWTVGQRVGVVISVPHRLDGAAADVVLDLRAEASVVRVEHPTKNRRHGEDGLPLTGVAVQFTEPLRFRYVWV